MKISILFLLPKRFPSTLHHTFNTRSAIVLTTYQTTCSFISLFINVIMERLFPWSSKSAQTWHFWKCLTSLHVSAAEDKGLKWILWANKTPKFIYTHIFFSPATILHTRISLSPSCNTPPAIPVLPSFQPCLCVVKWPLSSLKVYCPKMHVLPLNLKTMLAVAACTICRPDNPKKS